jgi:ParB family chromosome partitioning protein
MMKRKALGRGLRSLIPEAPPRAPLPRPTPAPGETLRQIDIDQIRPNRSQPRQDFDRENLEELARSMKRQGVLQPIVVRPAPEGTFELVAGERRWRAAQLAQLDKVPAIVREVDDERMLELALIENLQREDLNAIEAALAFQTLIDDLGLTQQEIAERVGKQRTTIANALRLLNLPTAIQEAVRSAKLSAGHARPLLGLSDKRAQMDLAQRIIRDELSVRQVEAIVGRLAADRDGEPERPSGKGGKPDPNVAAAVEALQSALQTRVKIVQGKSGGGRLELQFFSHEEFERVYQLILTAARRASTPE